MNVIMVAYEGETVSIPTTYFSSPHLDFSLEKVGYGSAELYKGRLRGSRKTDHPFVALLSPGDDVSEGTLLRMARELVRDPGASAVGIDRYDPDVVYPGPRDGVPRPGSVLRQLDNAVRRLAPMVIHRGFLEHRLRYGSWSGNVFDCMLLADLIKEHAYRTVPADVLDVMGGHNWVDSADEKHQLSLRRHVGGNFA